MKRKATIIQYLVLAAAMASLVSCGGSNSSSPPPVGTPVISTGTMTTGSTIVNGVRFEDTAANITADDSPKVLASGMIVKVKGTRNNDGVTGTADRIEVENEVRGPVAGLAGDSFTVRSQVVVVNASTVLAGGITFSGGAIGGLANGNNVEVHGQRLANGTIVATRVEKLTGTVVDEVRGIVSNLVLNTSFNIGALAITYTGTTQILPAGAVLANGALVEVHLGASNAATRIEIEDAEDGEFDPAEGQEVEIEGFISGFTAHPGHFFVSGREVQTNNLTRFEGGVAADLANNVKVEAEGHLVAGVLEVEKITFKDTIRIESNVQIASGATVPTSFTVLGKIVLITSATERNITLPIGGGVGVKVRGFVNTDGTITATRIDSTNLVADDKHILQGPVSSLNATERTMVILGITVDASTSNLQPHDIMDDNDKIVTLDQFFALLVADRTIVKARGTFGAGVLTANQIEIE